MTTDDVSSFIESTMGKMISQAVSWAFRILMLAVLTIAGYQFREFSTKIDNAAPKAVVDQNKADIEKTITQAKQDLTQTQTKLWEAIGSVTKSVNELSTNVTVLSTRVELQNNVTKDAIQDLKSHINQTQH